MKNFIKKKWAKLAGVRGEFKGRQKRYKTFLGTLTVKENHISQAVSQIQSYLQLQILLNTDCNANIEHQADVNAQQTFSRSTILNFYNGGGS